MAEHQVLGWGTQTAPAQRTNGGNESWELLAIDATFDGTGAAGSFVPAVQIISDAGEEVGTFPLAGSITAGSSAKVTFAPFLRDGVGLTGIYYDTQNKGDWLEVATTGTDPNASHGVEFLDSSGGGFAVTVTGPTGEFNVSAPFLFFNAQNGIMRFTHADLFDFNGTQLNASLDGGWSIAGSSGDCGLFGAAKITVSAGGEIQNYFGAGLDYMIRRDSDSHTYFEVLDTTGSTASGVNISLLTGQMLTVFDSGFNPIFEVREDGSIHGKAAVGAITWDL